jgi:hypothetical protein
MAASRAGLKVEDITTLPADVDGPRGSFTANVVDGWVYVRAFEPVAGDERGTSTPVSVEEMQAAIRRITGADVAIATLDGPRRGYDHARQATTYRSGGCSWPATPRTCCSRASSFRDFVAVRPGSVRRRRSARRR